MTSIHPPGGPFPRFSALHYVALRLLSETPQILGPINPLNYWKCFIVKIIGTRMVSTSWQSIKKYILHVCWADCSSWVIFVLEMFKNFISSTPWKFNFSRVKIWHAQRKGSSSKHHSSGVNSLLNFGGVRPPKLTFPLKTNGWKMYSLLKWVFQKIGVPPNHPF